MIGRGLGKLVAMLNPLEQSAAQQMMKAGGGGMGGAFNVFKGGARQVLSGGYFRGKTLGVGARGFQSQFSAGVAEGGSRALLRKSTNSIASHRFGAAVGVGAWAGLNVVAPDSILTKGMNYGAMGLGALALSRKITPGLWRK